MITCCAPTTRRREHLIPVLGLNRSTGQIWFACGDNRGGLTYPYGCEKTAAYLITTRSMQTTAGVNEMAMTKLPPKDSAADDAAKPNARPSASYSVTLRLRYKNLPGMLGKVTSAIGEVYGDIGAIDIVGVEKDQMIRDFTVKVRDSEHGKQLVAALNSLEYVTVVHVSDRTFLMHLGGKIRVTNKVPLATRDDLSMAYTPGVARVCMAIHEDLENVYKLTIKRSTVAVVTDGSAVLGLGNIGPEAALPVMEGKAMLFKEFGKVDAFPICLATQDTEEIIKAVKFIAPVFGGINLEDI